MKTRDSSGYVAALVCCLSLVSRPATAADGTWTNLNGGSWATAANWNSGSIAGGSGATAWFNTLALSANATVTLDGARTIGNLSFDDKAATKHNWTLNTGSAGSLTLDVSSGSPGISSNVLTTIATVLYTAS
jgi:hypothetical protein